MFGYNLGYGKVPLLSLWKGIYFGDRPKATSIDLQETYGGNFSKDPEVSSEKLPISTFQHVRYRKGVEIPLADALSRVTPLSMEEDGIQLPIITVNLVTVNIPYSSNELDIIHGETRKDPTIKILMHYISTGWPCECRRLPQELHPYWNFREDLSVKDGLVTKRFQTSYTFHTEMESDGTNP